MVFKILKKMVPKYLLEYYVFVSEVHCHSTRASSNDNILVGLRVKWEKNIFYILALLLGINYLGVFKRYKLIVFLEGKLKNGCFIIDVLKFVWCVSERDVDCTPFMICSSIFFKTPRTTMEISRRLFCVFYPRQF